MNKQTKILLGCSSVALLSMLTFAYATSSNQATIDADTNSNISQMSLNKSYEILDTLNSETAITNSKTAFDQLANQNYFIIENNDYTIKLDTNNSLKGIYSKEISTVATSSNLSKENAQEYICAKYNELNLPSQYELSYLEKYDDIIWQANFEKNYNGIYNKYESVKIFFIPDTNEIIALSVFNEPTTSSEVSISQSEAIQVASQELNIDSNDIVSVNLEMEKANNYYDSSNTDTSVHPTWKIQTTNDTFIFVDANTSNIIGGDEINE